MIAQYVVIEDHGVIKRGETVYELQKYDYGLARDDTNFTGIEHISATCKPDGGYPSFTIPACKLKRLN